MMGVSWQRLERFEYAVGAGIDADRRQIVPAHDSLAVDDEECTLRVAVFFTIRAVAARYGPFRLEVGEQREPQLARLGEGAVAPDAVDGDAQELRVVLLEFAPHLVVQRQLIAADGTPVGGIEDEDDRAAAEIAEANHLMGRGAQLEVRRGGAEGSKSGG